MIEIINPNELENIPQYLNQVILNNKNEKYIMFIFNDLYEHIINKEEFYERYCDLLKTYDLPYAFYPYYIHFNKILQNFASIPYPKMRCTSTNKESFDVVNQTAYGMLIIDNEKIKKINFKFNELFKKAFYIQELIEICFQKKLTISNSWYIDVYKSSEMIDDSMKNGFVIDVKDFAEEKTKFFNLFNQNQPESGNEFIQKIKERYFSNKNEDVITVNNTLNNNINDNLITVNPEVVK